MAKRSLLSRCPSYIYNFLTNLTSMYWLISLCLNLCFILQSGSGTSNCKVSVRYVTIVLLTLGLCSSSICVNFGAKNIGKIAFRIYEHRWKQRVVKHNFTWKAYMKFFPFYSYFNFLLRCWCKSVHEMHTKIYRPFFTSTSPKIRRSETHTLIKFHNKSFSALFTLCVALKCGVRVVYTLLWHIWQFRENRRRGGRSLRVGVNGMTLSVTREAVRHFESTEH